jgi:iron complex outermembrane receptor protein
MNNNFPCRRDVLACALSVFISAPVSAAEQKSYLTEDDLYTDIPVVSGASNFKQRLQDAPSSVTIIDQDMIRASGALELVEVFRLVPGMFSYYVNGGRHGVAHHAFADEYPQRLEIKVDGRSVYNPIYSSVEWTGLGIELQDIAYIEVIRGPNSPADGANAFQGTINIVTKSPVAQKGSSLRLEAGDLNTRNVSFVNSGTAGEIDYRATLRYRYNNGFSKEIPAFAGYYPHPNPDKGGALTSKLSLGELTPDDPQLDHIDDTEVTVFGLRTSYSPNLNNRFDIDLGFSDGEIGIGGDDEAEGDSFFRRDYEQNYQSIIWTHIVDDSSEFKTTFYRNYFSYVSGEDVLLSQHGETLNWAVKGKVTPQQLLAQYGLHDEWLETKDAGYSERYDLDSRWLKKFERVQFSIGGQYRHDLIDSDRFLAQQAPVDEQFARAYSNIEWKVLPATVFNAGVSADRDSTIGSHSSTRFAISQHIGAQQTVRISTSRATRGPSNLEANRKDYVYAQGATISAAFRPDPGQNEEQLSVHDIAYLGQFLNNRLTTSVRAYREDYGQIFDQLKQLSGSSPILYSEGNQIRHYANAAHLDNEGVEFELKYKNENGFLVALNYMTQNTEGIRLRREYPTDYEINMIDKATPAKSGGILLGYLPQEGWQYSLNWYYQSQVGCQEIVLDDKSCYVGAGFGEYDKGWLRGSFEDDHDRLDVRVARPFRFGGSVATISLIGHNVLNENYNEFHNFNVFKPRYYVQMALDF